MFLERLFDLLEDLVIQIDQMDAPTVAANTLVSDFTSSGTTKTSYVQQGSVSGIFASNGGGCPGHGRCLECFRTGPRRVSGADFTSIEHIGRCIGDDGPRRTLPRHAPDTAAGMSASAT